MLDCISEIDSLELLITFFLWIMQRKTISMKNTVLRARGRDRVAIKVLFWELEQHLKSSSGASVVAIDNKIEQAMDLVKSHLMYAVREEVEVLKEQIKELVERNSQLEQENNLLKTLASPEQLAQFQAQLQTTGCSPPVSQSGQTTQSTPPNGGSSA
ncbi:TSC22 domain family protein 1 isoform X4 [Mobula birostris]|uniref:TSC22 domain family protein 1 isoform X4 n=1 Tax=Mobula birostris TaxID=1983395 RepID=UPI003B27EA81